MSEFKCTLYVVEQKFRSGELNQTLQRGDVLEVDVSRRLARFKGGQPREIKAVLSAINQGWIRVARNDELEFISKHGYAPTREFETPDFEKIQADRAKAIQDTIPEDAKGEDLMGDIEKTSSRTLSEVQVKDTYDTGRGAKTQRAQGSAERPNTPDVESLTGDVDIRTSAKPDKPKVSVSEPKITEPKSSTKSPSESTDEPTYEGDFDYKKPLSRDRIAQLGAMEMEELERLLAFLRHRDNKDGKPRNVTAKVEEVHDDRKSGDVLAYDGSFDYKKPVSKKRIEELKAMPFEELEQLFKFLETRDQKDGKERVVTEKVKEVYTERIAEKVAEPDGAMEEEVLEGLIEEDSVPQEGDAENPSQVVSVSFDFNFDQPMPNQLSQARMTLTLAQVRELADTYRKIGNNKVAKQFDAIVAERSRKGGDEKRTENQSPNPNQHRPSIAQDEQGIIGAMTGKNPQQGPLQQSKQFKTGAETFLEGDEQDLLNAATTEGPMDIAKLAGKEAVEISPVGQTENETRLTDVGNQGPPPEAIQVVGSEEGETQVMPLGDKLAKGAKAERITGNDVQDISGAFSPGTDLD